MTFWIPLMILLVLCSVFFTYIWQQYRRRRELGMLCEEIERILQRRDEEGTDGGAFGKGSVSGGKRRRRIPYKDSFFSRVSHKLNRLERMMEGCYEQIAAERDSMKGQIEELARQLRTPLTNLEIYLDFLEGDDLSREEQRRYLDAVRVSEQKIYFLTESFIKMSELENGSIRISREEWDLRSTLEAVTKRLQSEMKAKRIAIKTDFPRKLHFPHDAEWLGEAVFHVLDNAVKYSDEGGKIELGARQSGIFTQIWVRDHGIGVKEGDESIVFRRFYRAENAKEQEGFGIGLTIAREIVRQHGGFMKAVREEDGTRMEISMEKP